MNDETRQMVDQWKAKADSDWAAVEILRGSERCPGDTVCFHCQQSVEKLLKALLTLHAVEAPKTHDIRRLIQLAQPFLPELSRFLNSSDLLTAHGVLSRYPDDWREISNKEMTDMIELTKAFRSLLLPKLE